MVDLTPEEYLNAELTSPVKHEFLGGLTYAMAGGQQRAQPHRHQYLNGAGQQAARRPMPGLQLR